MNTERTALFLMANLGSEVRRVLGAVERKDEDMTRGALVRAQTILEKLANIPEMEPRKDELRILRDVIEDIGCGSGRYSVSAHDLQNYFMPLAVRVLEESALATRKDV